MSRLVTALGVEFASGESSCFVRPGFTGDRLNRLLVHVAVGQERTTAVLDTGGAFLVLDPAFAATVGIDHADALAHDRIYIRGFVHHGTVHRMPLTLLATTGESLTFEATAFVPELEHGETWPLPSYLGWQGCLDRIRFAVDPADEVVYFGAAGV
ncbi:MAG: hypothetical protein QOJ98_2280 [Acidobacteriota bacterium]|nr:hypothetical protein [Acidobacteriota bacterium]